MNELALFAGAGGGLLGTHLLGWTPVCAVEIEPYCREILLRRQRDGVLPLFPIWDDVRSFDGHEWRGIVDVVTGGFPCQDISAASSTRTGINGERSGLWKEMFRIICEVESRFVFVENSSNLVSRGLDVVLSDLASVGFDARWGVFSAGDVGARHERERIFLAADRDGFVGWPRAWNQQEFCELANEPFCNGENVSDCESLWMEMAGKRAGMDDDVARRLDRTKAIGNGQVPAVVRAAWRLLT